MISGPGEAPGGDILVEGNLINPNSGVNFYDASHITNYLWPNELYLPLIASSGGGTGINPTPTTPSGTPTPFPDILEIEGVMGTYDRESTSYDNALNADWDGFGGSVAYQYNTWPGYFEVGQLGIYQANLDIEKFRVTRGFIEFDTTQIQTLPTTATLYIQIENKPIGMVLPQVVHKGTWPGYLLMDPNQPYRWKSFESAELVRFLETDSTNQSLDLSLSLPTSIIEVGDITHLLIRSGEEGTPPPTGEEGNCYACDRRIRYGSIKLVLVW
jgi:hypothetical protein